MNLHVLHVLHLSLLNQINLVLQDQYVQLHDLNGSKVFTGLWLGTRLISSDEEQGGVHHRGAVKHGGHENVVTRTVNKGYVTHQAVLDSIHGECSCLHIVLLLVELA